MIFNPHAWFFKITFFIPATIHSAFQCFDVWLWTSLVNLSFFILCYWCLCASLITILKLCAKHIFQIQHLTFQYVLVIYHCVTNYLQILWLLAKQYFSFLCQDNSQMSHFLPPFKWKLEVSADNILPQIFLSLNQLIDLAVRRVKLTLTFFRNL